MKKELLTSRLRSLIKKKESGFNYVISKEAAFLGAMHNASYYGIFRQEDRAFIPAEILEKKGNFPSLKEIKQEEPVLLDTLPIDSNKDESILDAIYELNNAPCRPLGDKIYSASIGDVIMIHRGGDVRTRTDAKETYYYVDRIGYRKVV